MNGINEEVNSLTLVKRLTRDQAKATSTISEREARFLVDYYYICQEDRKRANNQIRSLEQHGEPSEVIKYLAEQAETLESQVKRMLDVYVKSHPVGSWISGNFGFGPVLSAGFVAHLDITKAPTAGHFWAFAGLDPTKTWEKGQKRPWNADLRTLCCHPDTMVTTVNGLKPIKDIVVGDMVLTHKGRFCKVIDTHESQFAGFMVGLNTIDDSKPTLYVTDNHPVFCKIKMNHNSDANPDSKYFNALPNEQIRIMREDIDSGKYTVNQLTDKYGCDEETLTLVNTGKFSVYDLKNKSLWLRSVGVKPHYQLLQLELEDPELTNTVVQTWIRAKESTLTPYAGPVYNLEVEEDNSYTANSYAVHNCWKAGQCMMKFSNKEECYYGQVYKKAKEYYVQKNEALDYSAQAKSDLDSGRYKERVKQSATENGEEVNEETFKRARFYLEQGKLPPVHIDARARRYAVKIFLSHLHEVWYKFHYKTDPPKPFALAILGHAHKIEPPSYIV